MMYKKQMKIQKIVCFMVLISAVITFLYALGIMSDLFESFYFSIRNPQDASRNPIPGSLIFYDMQPFNKLFLHASLGLILAALALFVTSTHVRRKYYIGNIITTCLNVVLNLYVVVWASAQIQAFRSQFLREVDFQAFQEYAQKRQSYYTESTFWFDVHTVVFGITVITEILLVVNLIWKFRLMNEEKQLLAAGKEKRA